MTLSIIIVNYKSEQLIFDALSSFLPGTTIDAEIIIVDNASGENRLQGILKAFPGVKVVQMGYNAGFARANNEGIKQSSSEIVLLLNPDTLAPNHAIEQCYQKFRDSQYVACGVQLLNADGSPQISGNYFMKGGLNNLLPLPIIGELLRWLGEKLKVKKPNVPDSNTLVEVDWINGAFLMVKKKAIQDAGLLDEDFFLYAEEIEWCARLRKAGKLCIYGDLKVTHLQGETANQSFASSGKGYYNLYDRKGLQILVSNFLRIRKQFGTGWFLLHLLVYLVEVPVLFLGFLIGQLTTKKTYPFSMLKGYVINMIRLLGLTPRLLLNRPYFYKLL
ncbi:glycosyltransferase family 2 protein [Flavihumibacter profundi]|uniref:glycosyltransferase family 2 protein n=1 Tax=Flavihumibacter profundi TaxID=2716883 RepID=UPI001CC4D4CD|nr:glycosyltransferase family 2 protein [Flavihumibacter profundi]MBZ5856365.1 glycosyltransferase family 2 protein [Flavihumibacter profundi]